MEVHLNIENQARSVSQTQQYEQCGWRFYLQRVERVVPRPAAWSSHGTAFHSAVEVYEKSGRALPVEAVVQLFSDRYSELVNKGLDKEPNTDRWLAAGRPGGADIEHRYVLGQEQAAYYVRWAAENPTRTWTTPDGQPGVELYFLVKLGGVQVRGFIDQLVQDDDGSVRPRDWKTGSTKSKFQLQTYAVAIRKLYNIEVLRADWYLAKEGRLSRPVKLEDLREEEVGERFADMDAAVKRGDFPARPGFQCRFCDVSHACTFRK
ncbi:PD-(D/E)XK nuclease family protein [Streptomyces luteireticuli]|uniref:PD-(D/E)XK endonuclease-like domain-containing protein n=1 Tax=Streptomyces luteireticuli TaxID=173858 RepID=A0ABN0YQY0_9ACTN